MKFRVSIIIVFVFVSYLLFSNYKPNEVPSAFASTNPATLQDYWDGNASWQFEKQFPDYFNSAYHIEIVPSTGNKAIWHFFYRTVIDISDVPMPANASCLPGYGIGTDVRSVEVDYSDNNNDGKPDLIFDWANSLTDTITAPALNEAWNCASTDGDIFYQADGNNGSGRWHYLFQCLDATPSGGPNAKWNGCHLQSDSGPTGPYYATHQNPVIQNGELWGGICDQIQDDCVSLANGIDKVYDEGTFEIFNYDGTYFWASFHGYDGVRGYRGIAKTTDFDTWISGNESQGLPKDAIFDASDAQVWRENWLSGGSVGGGHGSLLKEGDYHYLFVEAADTNLGCTSGQNWDIGVLRSSSLTSLNWEQYPLGNPISYSTNMVPTLCNLRYPQVIKDPMTNEIYYKVSVGAYNATGVEAGNYLYLYKLVPSNNLLTNGDLWRADTHGWQKFSTGPTNMVVYRDPKNASDHNNYLAMNCGTAPNPCQSGQSIYQDVDVSSYGGYGISFGGKFKTVVGNGSMHVMVHQLAQGGGIIRSDSKSMNLNSNNYQSFNENAIIDPNAKILRYQIYMDSNTTFRADEMYVNLSTSPVPTPTPIPTSTPSPTPTALPYCASTQEWNAQSPALGHVIGRAEAGGWGAATHLDSQGFLQFGPYVRANTIGSGNRVAQWSLMVDNNTHDNYNIVRLEVYNYDDNQILASRIVTRQEWQGTWQYECFSVPFQLTNSHVNDQDRIELRVWWYDKSYVREQKVGVK